MLTVAVSSGDTWKAGQLTRNKQYITVFANCPLSHPCSLAAPGIMPFHFLSLYFSPCPGGFHLFWPSPRLLLFHKPALWAWTLFEMMTECQKSCTWAEISVLHAKRSLWHQGTRSNAPPFTSSPILAPLQEIAPDLCRMRLLTQHFTCDFSGMSIMLPQILFSFLLLPKCQLPEGRTHVPFYLCIL